MTQMKIIKNKDISRMEKDVNVWMARNRDKIKVINISTNTMMESQGMSKDSIQLCVTTITYEDKPVGREEPKGRILHEDS